uniref:Uncharacterized protein n=1 Tax=Oncorhynchus tshawytscha TaxID=74940 RepID=A0A8C8EJ44_ONCTS
MTPTFLFWSAGSPCVGAGCGTPRSSPGTDGRSTAPAAPSYSSTCSQTGCKYKDRYKDSKWNFISNANSGQWEGGQNDCHSLLMEHDPNHQRL